MIKSRLKQCGECPKGKLSILWRSNPPLCKSHAMIQIAKKQIKEGKASKDMYDDFCRNLWKKRNHISELSGDVLPEYDPHNPKFCNLIRFHMHHFWAKSKHPELMFDETNIVFLTREEHAIVEFGSDAQKEKIRWNKFVQNRNQ